MGSEARRYVVTRTFDKAFEEAWDLYEEASSPRNGHGSAAQRNVKERVEDSVKARRYPCATCFQTSDTDRSDVSVS